MFDELLKDIESSFDKPSLVKVGDSDKLTIPHLVQVARSGSKIKLDISKGGKNKIERVHKEMMSQVKEGVPIYGVNAAYGARVSLLLNKGDEIERLKLARELSRSIIHVDVSTGPSIEKEIVRAAILLRLKTLLAGHSAVRIKTIRLLGKLLNLNVTPIVGQYGSLGASGDLAMNGRILTSLLQLKGTKVIDEMGRKREATTCLKNLGIKPIQLEPKEGLALTNGDNFSTASALFIAFDIVLLMLINTAVMTLTIQALKGSVRNYHPLLSELRPHPGQVFTSNLLLKLLKDSKLAHQDLKTPKLRNSKQDIQDPYSVRCLPQYFGPDWEALINCWQTLRININSVSDNPLWTTPEYAKNSEENYQWVSGGNFLAMHMVEVVDRLRKIATHIIKQNDRHLARIVHPNFNNGLPPNLSDERSISQTVFKGLQNQMGMYEVYSTVLSTPVSTQFGTHEEFNQDLTSHAFTSGILAKELINITKYAVATNFIASCQAIDLRGGSDLLSPATKPFYFWLRERVPYVKKEQPLGNYVEKVSKDIMSNDMTGLLITVTRKPPVVTGG